MIESFYTHSKKEIFNAILTAASKLELVISEKSFSKGVITLKHPGSLFSYGNIVDVKIASSVGSKHFVAITSRSSASLQKIDWGTNIQLEANVNGTIKKLLEQ